MFYILLELVFSSYPHPHPTISFTSTVTSNYIHTSYWICFSYLKFCSDPKSEMIANQPQDWDPASEIHSLVR